MRARRGWRGKGPVSDEIPTMHDEVCNSLASGTHTPQSSFSNQPTALVYYLSAVTKHRDTYPFTWCGSDVSMVFLKLLELLSIEYKYIP